MLSQGQSVGPLLQSANRDGIAQMSEFRFSNQILTSGTAQHVIRKDESSAYARTDSMRLVTGLGLSLILLVAMTGCQLGTLSFSRNSKMMDCPWTFSQQQRELEQLIHPGASRAEVEQKLNAAGIVVAPGSTPALAYCDVWNRPNGEHWRMNVALQFDSKGMLMGMRSAQSDTGVLAGGAEPMDEQRTPPQAEDRERSGTSPAGKRRTPFEERKASAAQ